MTPNMQILCTEKKERKKRGSKDEVVVFAITPLSVLFVDDSSLVIRIAGENEEK
jgi:hypothetical protein